MRSRPSPFTCSVLVVLAVDDSRQQGYFLGDLRRNSSDGRSMEQSTSSRHPVDGAEDNAFVNAEAAEQLLEALHAAFPRVPLSASAQECLSSCSRGTTAPNSTSIAETAKYRKTLSPKAFYGVTTLTPRNVSSWSAFYEKLQFRVSRSLMCQLEGTAPISSSFPRQLEAFEFADQVAALRRRLRPALDADPRNGADEERVPRVFSFESAGDGKRRFLVASLGEFWRKYLKTRADQRHVYEIIREGVPCRLYFDLEFKRAINPDVDGDALVKRLVSLLQLQLYRRYDIHVAQHHVRQLDSSTASKFSRHLIFHFPHGELFADNLHAGAFVRDFLGDLVASGKDEMEELDATSTGTTPFLVNTVSADRSDKKQLFIDTGVYTRNRMFRVLGSSKYRKRAVLRRLDGSSSSHPSDLELELDLGFFLDTLVCPYASLEAMQLQQRRKPSRLLRCEPSQASLQRSRLYTRAVPGSRLSSARSVECKQSIFPALDAFICSQAVKGGVQGEIRAIQMLMESNGTMLAVLPGQESSNAQPSTEKVAATSRPWMLIYHMARNRWCANVGRPHKSNNVMFIVDVGQRVFYQKCHDPACQASDFRSPPLPLPAHIVLEEAQA